MSDFYEDFRKQARVKLDAGVQDKLDRYGEAMKRAVHDALVTFCEQDGEFAQAVAQGGEFKDCMAAVVKCVKGNVLSDMEAFGAAVRFYFPGAGLDVKMTINLCAGVEKGRADEETKKSDVVIDLSDWF